MTVRPFTPLLLSTAVYTGAGGARFVARTSGTPHRIRWTFFEGDTLPRSHQNIERVVWVDACADQMECDYVPAKSGRMEVQLRITEIATPQYATSDVIRAGATAPSLKLTCTGNLGENRVTRGDTINCTASKAPADAPGELAIQGWSFEGRERKDGDITSRVWSGVMAVAGRVEVRGSVGGQPVPRSSVFIDITRRDWSTHFAAFKTEAVPHTLAEKPTRSEELGTFYPAVVVSDLTSAIPVIDHGPNSGYAYVVDNPFGIVGQVQVNTTALQVGSAFWARQASAQYTNIFGVTMCSRADVLPFVPIVFAHEGIPINPASHAGLFETEIRKGASTYLEELTAVKSGPEETDEVRSRVFGAAEAAYEPRYRRALAADSKADDPSLAPKYCTFRYFQ